MEKKTKEHQEAVAKQAARVPGWYKRGVAAYLSGTGYNALHAGNEKKNKKNSKK